MTRNENINKRLKGCNSFLDMVHVLRDFYEIDGKLGVISKGIVIHQFPRLLKRIGIKEKPEWKRAKEV